MLVRPRAIGLVSTSRAASSTTSSTASASASSKTPSGTDEDARATATTPCRSERPRERRDRHDHRHRRCSPPTDVTVRFGGVVALDQVSLTRARRLDGRAWSGPNGAGKTTLFGVLSGLIRPRSGRVAMNGIDVTHRSPQHRAHVAGSPARSSAWSCSPSSPCASTWSSPAACARAASGCSAWPATYRLRRAPRPRRGRGRRRDPRAARAHAGRRPTALADPARHRPPARGGARTRRRAHGHAARRAVVGPRRARDRAARRRPPPGPPGRGTAFVLVEHNVEFVLGPVGPHHRPRLRQGAGRGQSRGDPHQSRGAGGLLRRTDRTTIRRPTERGGMSVVRNRCCEVTDLEVAYGEARALFGVSLRRARRFGHDRAGRQRCRQVVARVGDRRRR